MAKRKTKKKSGGKPARKKTARGKKETMELIISKSRTKHAAGIDVSGEFYHALDGAVRSMIAQAEQRALDNGRTTLRPYDL